MVRTLGFAVLLAALGCTGCGNSDFGPEVAEVSIGAQPIKLDGEQLMLNESQISCGVQNDLWEPPTQSGDRKVARLLSKARDLKFYDDVVVEDHATNGASYVQVRGDFMVRLQQPVEIHDADHGEKLVNGKAGAIIDHPCFMGMPLPIMGVRKGQFSADAPLQLRYSQANGKDWSFDRLVH